MDNVIKKLNDKEYDFLKINEHLGKNIILLTLGGSYAYNLNIETSDLDIRGIAIERKNEIFGLSNFEQFIDDSTDTTIYGFKKIIKLLLNCNPNIIEILGTKKEHIFNITKEGQMLRDNAHLFLTKKAMYSFGGYATSQLRRLQNALARNNYPQAEKEKHILNSINNQLNHLQKHYTNFINKEIQ